MEPHWPSRAPSDGKNRIEYPIGTVLLRKRRASAVAGARFAQGRSDRVLRIRQRRRQTMPSRCWTCTARSGFCRAAGRNWADLAWSPKGDEIWFGGTKAGGEPALRAVTLNGKERTVVETPAFMVLDDITRDDGGAGHGGRFAPGDFGAGPGRRNRNAIFRGSMHRRIYDISADGETILFVEMSYGTARNTAIYLRKTDGSPAVRLGDGNRPRFRRTESWWRAS